MGKTHKISDRARKRRALDGTPSSVAVSAILRSGAGSHGTGENRRTRHAAKQQLRSVMYRTLHPDDL